MWSLPAQGRVAPRLVFSSVFADPRSPIPIFFAACHSASSRQEAAFAVRFTLHRIRLPVHSIAENSHFLVTSPTARLHSTLQLKHGFVPRDDQ